MSESAFHLSVLLNELVTGLNVSGNDIVIDCTVGAGGHTELILDKLGENGLVIGIDRDESALEIARRRLANHLKAGRLILERAPFSALHQLVEKHGIAGRVAAICADIGVSSMHLDEAHRGFSFQEDGPLDMRMDQSLERTAADIIAQEDEEYLTRLLREYGEEPKAKQIARRIVQTRVSSPIETTRQLADLVKAAASYPTKSRKHPATRTFQALRMAVNNELGELAALLDSALAALKPGGRLAIISFHSLEDRLVKQRFIASTGRHERENIPRDLPLRASSIDRLVQASAQIIKPFPVVPSDAEIATNPRARSAKMRVLMKL
jgi:16S rRNA (cytosine1402-N4)-methyltransferase